MVSQQELLDPYFWIVVKEDYITLHSHPQTYEMAIFLKIEALNIFCMFLLNICVDVDRRKVKWEVIID